MARMLLRLVLVATLLVPLAVTLPQTTHGATEWFVANTGEDGDDCSSPGTACQTIQAAIDKASSGDIVNVAAGTYAENVTIEQKSVTLASISGPDSTVLDGGGQGSVVKVGEGAEATIQGFTITNAGGTYSFIGVIRGNPEVSIWNNRIVNN